MALIFLILNSEKLPNFKCDPLNDAGGEGSGGPDPPPPHFF